MRRSLKRMFTEINKTLPPGLSINRILLIFFLGIALLFVLMQIIYVIEGKTVKKINN